MAYKSVGTFDTEPLYELYDDLSKIFDAVSDTAIDITVVEVGAPDEESQPELWHDDYAVSDGAWTEAGEFEDWWAASDAAKGFPDGTAIAVFDYSDSTAKLMVRDGATVDQQDDG